MPFIDTHCDTPTALFLNQESILKNGGHVSLEQVKGLGGHLAFYAVWVEPDRKNLLQYVKDVIAYCKKEMEKNADLVEQATDAAGIERILDAGKCGVMFAAEDGRSLEGNIENVSVFHDLGIRSLCLAHNAENDLTGGVNCSPDKGLTPFGKQVVKEMNRLRMMIDVSHITEKGFWDVMSCTEAPVFASHACARALCDHPRNLKDEQIKALIAEQGMINVCIYPTILKEGGVATVSDYVNHLEHILLLGGENHLGIGTDFDGVDSLPRGISGAKDFGLLAEEMEKRGFSDALIQKITYKNMINYIKRIEK